MKILTLILTTALASGMTFAQPSSAIQPISDRCTTTEPPLSESGRWALVFDFDGVERPWDGCLVVWPKDLDKPIQRRVPCEVRGRVNFDNGRAAFDRNAWIECQNFAIAELAETEKYTEFFILARGMATPDTRLSALHFPAFWHPSVQFGARASRYGAGTVVTRLGDWQADAACGARCDSMTEGDMRFDYANGILQHRAGEVVIGESHAPTYFEYVNRPATIYIGLDPNRISTHSRVSIDLLIVDPNVSGGF